MKILVVNAGSSSLKYQLFDMDENKVIAKGLCEKIGIGGAVTHKRPGKDDYKSEIELKDHDDAIALVLKLLTDSNLGVIKSVDEIDAVGHRVAHGGKLQESMIVTDSVLRYLESIVGINPLHGPPAIKGINACRKAMPGKPMVTVFDTSFHSTMPEKSYIYALPYEYYEKYQVRRYGFHGTSHRYVAHKAAEFVRVPLEQLLIITCHCGNGSSITAVDHGKVINTAMGLTPQEGLPMGTRCGSIDPTIVTYLMKQENLTPDQMDDVLNKKSGLLGLSGVSSDMRDVWAAADAGNERAKLALDVLVQDAKKIIGSYIAEMNGVDIVLFTAGIGENDRAFRAAVCRDMDYLGISIDEDFNMSCPRGENVDISAPDAKVRTLVIPTDEELMIALDTLNLVK
ncbi:MAG: acetate kinase [Clostridia bacterium]|nr:acetate kinase [Clostridia bacterium]